MYFLEWPYVRLFPLQRGYRQGDLISPYIFILYVGDLAKMLRKDKQLSGIKINDKEYTISQDADDTQIFLNGSEKSLKLLM